ncbi:MAG: CCA tRNA nucleotidyltransferase [Sulfurovum sp.]|jgi:tRNA nucleotidyltransferase (CCA-adding enzyme)|nr:CCA tRNA nucleotidyltransferase [Sulfurovum sp.]
MPTTASFSNFFSQTPPDTLRHIQTVTQYLIHDCHAKCYIVGGAVRDRLLGRDCQDYDIECFNISIETFEKAMMHLGAEGVGKNFFVYKFYNLDISLPRKETKSGKGHKGFHVMLAGNEKEASRRRDFTVNALMYDIEKEQILDFWNGLGDLQQKHLKVVDEKSFVEDSLRVLRAMQFAARLGFKVEKKSCKLCQNISLEDLPKERIFSEFEKMFKGTYLHYGLYYLFALGIAKKLFNEEIDQKTFMSWSKELQNGQKYFQEALRPYYFLFIARKYFKSDMDNILKILGAPKCYHRQISQAPFLPFEVDIRFVLRTALKEGIEKYPGNYDPRVVALAKTLKVWQKPFSPKTTANKLLEEGFSGKKLGEELTKRISEEIDFYAKKGV